jgi:Protein of unknown function (DUF3237)
MNTAPNPPLESTLTPPPVGLRLVWSAVVDVGPKESLGPGGRGERWMVPILGGQFWGAQGFEHFHGLVRAGGADRQTLRPDGVKELDALYEMQTHDGAVITIRNQVVVDDTVQPERYAMSTIRVTAPAGPHAHLNRRVFVGTLQPLRPAREAVLVRGYLVTPSVP